VSDYNGQDDAKKSWELAVEALRGHAYVRLAQDTIGPAEIVVHRFFDGRHEEFVAPLSVQCLDILAAQIANLRLRLK
jgi:hypothetical protein